MRRNRRSNTKKERAIMITSSALVLAALTMTGLYIKNQNEQSEDDGYSIDFTALENNVDDKFQEIARNEGISIEEEIDRIVNDDALDYMPVEVGSGDVEIPGLTDKVSEKQEETTDTKIMKENPLEEMVEQEIPIEETALEQAPILSFTEEKGLLRPVSGEILMHYSMDGSIYFQTLDQYKYNPAVIFSVAEGTQVIACAEGKVIEIFTDAQIGKAVTLDLGNGYRATYGQLRDIGVTLGSHVNAGDILGFVAAPTKYFSLEGSNLYFKLSKNDAAVNPEELFR